MKMRALVALVNFPYGGKALKIGQLFTATEKDARILAILKRAQIDPAGIPGETKDVADTPPRLLVEEAMATHNEPRRRGRPRKFAVAE